MEPEIPEVLIPKFPSEAMLDQTFSAVKEFFPFGYALAKTLVSYIVVLSIPLSIFFLIGIIYCVQQLKKVREKEKLKYDVKVEPAFEKSVPEGNRDLAVRWHKIQSLINSENQNDWKQAILEADSMLLDVLTGLGYRGEGVGEKLKRVQPGEIKDVDAAWEAHKVRNQIAHESGFAITHHDAVRTIHLYRKVFEEFYYI